MDDNMNEEKLREQIKNGGVSGAEEGEDDESSSSQRRSKHSKKHKHKHAKKHKHKHKKKKSKRKSSSRSRSRSSSRSRSKSPDKIVKRDDESFDTSCFETYDIASFKLEKSLSRSPSPKNKDNTEKGDENPQETLSKQTEKNGKDRSESPPFYTEQDLLERDGILPISKSTSRTTATVDDLDTEKTLQSENEPQITLVNKSAKETVLENPLSKSENVKASSLLVDEAKKSKSKSPLNSKKRSKSRSRSPKSKKRKSASRSKSRSKSPRTKLSRNSRSRSSSYERKKPRKKSRSRSLSSKSRSRSPRRKRHSSKDRRRSKSIERKRSRSRDRRGKSTDRRRSRSRERKRSRSRDRRSRSPQRGSRRSYRGTPPRKGRRDSSYDQRTSRRQSNYRRSRSASPRKQSSRRSRSRSPQRRYRGRSRSPSRQGYRNRSRSKSRSRRSRSRSYSSRRRRSRTRSRSKSRDRSKRRSRSKSDDSNTDSKKTAEKETTSTNPTAAKDLVGKAPTVSDPSNKKSLAMLTEFCKKLTEARGIADNNEKETNEEAKEEEEEEEEEESVISHPFLVAPKKDITIPQVIFPVKPMLPPVNMIDTSKPLMEQFPVSCGTKHHEKETEDSSLVTTIPNINDSAAVQPPQTVFQQPQIQEKLDISSLVVKRMDAQRRLQADANDVDAMLALQEIEMKLNNWCQSNVKPGQFTGQLAKQMMPKEKMNAGFQAWAKKDMFQNLNPVSSGIGMKLLQKMGWAPGQVLGKSGKGMVEPIALPVKVDRKGLSSTMERPLGKKGGPVVQNLNAKTPMDLQGKHPISLLQEYCARRKWNVPEFTLIFDEGPPHSKQFLFKVLVNGYEYQNPVVSGNKKHAKAQAAVAALKGLGLVPEDAQF